MLLPFFGVLRYTVALIFGVKVTFLFANVKRTKKNALAAVLCVVFTLLAQLFVWDLAGLQAASRLYPFIVHLPLFLMTTFYFKRSWSISISSVATAYLCCQLPRWISIVVLTLFKAPVSEHIGYIIVAVLVYMVLKHYIAPQVHRLMEQSFRACILFAIVPILYYVFDYTTTIYTDWLYQGTEAVAQFAPSLICSFYFLFVALYSTELRRQSDTQRDIQIFSKQLSQAKTELNSLKQLNNQASIYRHDMRHHFSLLSSFAADGNIDKIKAYLTEVQKSIDEITPNRFCEDEIVNLILTSFANKASAVDVELVVKINTSNQLPTSDTETCTILSNALENALIATQNVNDGRERKIIFNFGIYEDKRLLEIRNPYCNEIVFEGSLPISTSVTSGHGYGVRSIASIVSKHHGMLFFKVKNGEFIMRIIM